MSRLIRQKSHSTDCLSRSDSVSSILNGWTQTSMLSHLRHRVAEPGDWARTPNVRIVVSALVLLTENSHISFNWKEASEFDCCLHDLHQNVVRGRPTGCFFLGDGAVSKSSYVHTKIQTYRLQGIMLLVLLGLFRSNASFRSTSRSAKMSSDLRA